MTVKYYKNLLIWNKAKDLVKEVYIAIRKFPEIEKYILISQILRSANSIPTNIAEGQARQHSKEFIQFLHIALGSLAELDTQLCISKDLGYLTEEELNKFDMKITELRKMTRGLISKL